GALPDAGGDPDDPGRAGPGRPPGAQRAAARADRHRGARGAGAGRLHQTALRRVDIVEQSLVGATGSHPGLGFPRTTPSVALYGAAPPALLASGIVALRRPGQLSTVTASPAPTVATAPT